MNILIHENKRKKEKDLFGRYFSSTRYLIHSFIRSALEIVVPLSLLYCTYKVFFLKQERTKKRGKKFKSTFFLF